MNAVRKYSIYMAIVVVLIFGSTAFAQTVISSPAVTVAPCVSITHTLRYGMYDRATGGDVSALQNFLHAKGYLSVPATGYFGPLTLRAVKAFQLASASGAVDGIVGVQTQAHIRAMDCQTTTVSAPTILNITPSSGMAGSTVTLTGTGFTPTGNIVHFGVGAITNLSALVIPVPSSGPAMQQLSFTVPSSIGPYCKPGQACPMYAVLITNGSYPVSVENANGSSTSVQFTVVGNATVIPH